MKKLIEIKNVTKSYGTKKVLAGLDLTVRQGEIIALLGENGAGKTTLINIINGLSRATSGEVVLFLPQSKIGVMLQSNLTLNRVKVSEVLKLARSYYDKPLAYSELLRLSALTEKENALMTELSGGQKRRLSFALALAGDPDLIFLDEPTTGMDAERRKEFWLEIARLQALGKTFFVTSHYLEELENIASRLVLLASHVVKFDGTLADLRAQNAATEISFNYDGKLPTTLQSVVSTDRTGNFYFLTTNDTNRLTASLVRLFDKGLTNLCIQHNSLDHLFGTLVSACKGRKL